MHSLSSCSQTETSSYRSLWERWMRAARWLRTRHRCEISRHGATILFSRFYYKLFSAPTSSRNIVASGVLVCMNTHPEVLLFFTRVYLGGRLLRDMTSLVDQQAKEYIDNLQKLRSSLSEHADVSAAVMVHRVCGELQNIGRAIPSFSHLPFNH